MRDGFALILATCLLTGCTRAPESKVVDADLKNSPIPNKRPALEENKDATVDHPLLEKLRKADAVAAKRFPSRSNPGFSALGLLLHPQLERFDYWCTPKNVVTFARTGGNGVHFSFLAHDGKVTENSPVVITIPSPGNRPNYIVGENLFDFLCLGIHRGFFALEQLPADRLFDAYSSATWEPNTRDDNAVGFGVDEHQRKLLSFLRDEFRLEPWKNLRKKFERLQKDYLPQLQLP